MCLILMAWRVCPDAPLVLAANRDEYHGRPALPAHAWEDHPRIHGGRDLQAGGSWLAVDRAGRFAAVTNLRVPGTRRPGARSRGLLVSDYLQGSDPPAAYLRGVLARAGEYDPFNLLAGDADGLWFLGARSDGPLALGAGLYGVSNGELDCPWPKVRHGKAGLERILAARPGHHPESISGLFALLADRNVPDDALLPDTGIGIEQERRLAPLFVQAGDYGTRSSTVIVREAGERVHLHERRFDARGAMDGETRLRIEP
jgi:uncharacterized protein with NRDE domain